MSTQKPQKLMTVREVSEWLQISEVWVRHHATGRRRPYLPTIRMGKTLRFDETAVTAWLGEMSSKATQGRVNA